MSTAVASTSPSLPVPANRSIALAGLLALAVAMGIGRFAFTPLLPLMLADGTLDIGGASLLASANYLGYLVGALFFTLQPWLWQRLGRAGTPEPTRMLRGGLAATVLLAAAMALPLGTAAYGVLRFAAGVASAVVFVATSGWCLGQLAQRGVPALGAVIYAGPGAGIVASGLAATAIVALQGRAATGWIAFGLLAAVLSACTWRVFQAPPGQPAAGVAAAAALQGQATAPAHGRLEMALLVLAYGIAGFGYIITATFLPVIARAALPGSIWLDLFWPVFGLGVVAGALVASRLRGDKRWLLAGCYLVQAAGVLASLASPTLAGFTLGSLLLGLPFTAITFFALQEVRRLRPATAPSAIGLATAMYGIGQIAGPPLAAALVARAATPAQGFGLALAIAAGALLAGAALYVLSARLYR